MSTLRVYKLTALPSTYQPNAVYLIAPPGSSYTEVYISSQDGSAVRRVIREQDVQALIDSALAGFGSLEIVADIAARNTILNPPNGKHVLVLDATGDPTVSSGAASYVWRSATSQWIKLTEYESLDLSLTWNAIQGRPTSSPSQIDTAVANSHTHSNMTQLTKIGEDANGEFQYDGQYVRARIDTVGW